MLSRLPIRSLLTAVAGLAVGFAGALGMLALAAEVDATNLLFRVAVGYLTWVLLALLTILVIRRLLPARDPPGTDTGDAAAGSDEIAGVGRTEGSIVPDGKAAAGIDEVDASRPQEVPVGRTDRRALVTGGAGFIGSTLVDRLVADGWTVTAYDNFDPSYPREQKLANLAAVAGHARFRLIEGDTRDADALAAAFRQAAPHVVFDLAARAGVRPSIADPAAYIDVNVRGLQTLIAEVAACGARLVFASSSSIYGDDDRRPFIESQARGRPESPYGATKIAGEALVHAHHAITGLPVGVARLFTVYGPRQRPDLAIHAFARAIIDGRPIELFDEGRGLRDYTYVDDVVEALVRIADAPDPFLLVNVGSHYPVETTVVVEEIERALGMYAERRLLPAQAGDVPATFADVSLARERLGWEPQMPFGTGIERFCEWLRPVQSPPRHSSESPEGALAPPPTAT